MTKRQCTQCHLLRQKVKALRQLLFRNGFRRCSVPTHTRKRPGYEICIQWPFPKRPTRIDYASRSVQRLAALPDCGRRLALEDAKGRSRLAPVGALNKIPWRQEVKTPAVIPLHDAEEEDWEILEDKLVDKQTLV